MDEDKHLIQSVDENESSTDSLLPENNIFMEWRPKYPFFLCAALAAIGGGYAVYKQFFSTNSSFSSNHSNWIATSWTSFVHQLSLKRVTSLIYQGDTIYYQDADGKNCVTGLIPGASSWLFDRTKTVPILLSVPLKFRRYFPISAIFTSLKPNSNDISLTVPNMNRIIDESHIDDQLMNCSQKGLNKLMDGIWGPLVLLTVTAASLFMDWPFTGNMKFLSTRFDSANSTQKKIVKFSDVAGHTETKIELLQLIDFLKHPHRLIKLGARIPRGILLEGESGVGKTLLAKAISGEAGVPFFYVPASSFVEIYVGQGASRIRQVFCQARRNAPCVLFIDELDTLGTSRALLGNSNQEYVQTLNQLLTEMDGLERSFDTKGEIVIVIGATNRYHMLDEALTRPGRFDRIVSLKHPTEKEREELCRLHTRTKNIDYTSVKFSVIAQLTNGWTGAEIECLFNESALLAARQQCKQIKAKHVAQVMSILYQRKKRAATVLAGQKQSHSATDNTQTLSYEDLLQVIQAMQRQGH